MAFWLEIDTAFSANEDPLFGDQPSRENRDLFKLIANLAPEPYGAGPTWSPDFESGS